MKDKRSVTDDPTIKKESGSGIKVGEQTLEEWIDEQEALEHAEGTEQVRKQGESKQIHYHHKKEKFKPLKQRHGRVRRWSQFEINQRERSKLMAQVESVLEAVLVKLISSEEKMSVVDLTEFAKKSLNKPELTPSSVASVVTALKRSEMGYFLDGDNAPEGKGMIYWLVPEAKNMTFAQAKAVYLKNNKDGVENVVKSIPTLEKYVSRGNKWIGVDTRPDSFKKARRKKTEVESTEDTGKQLKDTVDGVKSTVDELSEVNSTLNKAIEGVIRQALGLDVSVNGRIDIVFSFKLGE